MTSSVLEAVLNCQSVNQPSQAIGTHLDISRRDIANHVEMIVNDRN